MAAEENIETVERWIETMRSIWDGAPVRELVDRFFEPDADYYPARKFPGSAPRHGAGEIAAFLEMYRDAWGRIDWEAIEVRAVGDDRVVVRGRLLGEGRGSGLEMAGEVFTCFWLRGGRIFRQEDHLTEAGAHRAVGG